MRLKLYDVRQEKRLKRTEQASRAEKSPQEKEMTAEFHFHLEAPANFPGAA
jgi:hypothetical protein